MMLGFRHVSDLDPLQTLAVIKAAMLARVKLGWHPFAPDVGMVGHVKKGLP